MKRHMPQWHVSNQFDYSVQLQHPGNSIYDKWILYLSFSTVIAHLRCTWSNQRILKQGEIKMFGGFERPFTTLCVRALRSLRGNRPLS